MSCVYFYLSGSRYTSSTFLLAGLGLGGSCKFYVVVYLSIFIFHVWIICVIYDISLSSYFGLHIYLNVNYGTAGHISCRSKGYFSWSSEWLCSSCTWT